MIPLVDCKAQYRRIRQDINNALQETLDSGHYIYGHNAQEFEKEFAAYCGARFAVGVNSVTDALLLGIRALGYHPGDEIILSANAPVATVHAIIANNATPVFVDIDENDFTINPTALEKKITTQTRAIVVSYTYGLPARIEEIQDSINNANQKIDLIEDATHAIGATYQDKKVGTFGVFSAFSFHPHSVCGAYGDAGALVTNSPKINAMVNLLKNHGQQSKYHHVITGINSRLDEIHAAVLRVKLPYVDTWIKERHEVADFYTTLLHEQLPFVHTPNTHKDRTSSYSHYVIRVPDRDALVEHLTRHDIQAGIHYPIPPHLQRACIHLGYVENDMPVTEEAARDVLSLPISPEITAQQCRYVVETIGAFFNK